VTAKLTRSVAEVGDEVEIARLAATDTRSWWVRGRRALVASVLREHVQGAAGKVVADLGCGAGGLCDTLRLYGRVVGIDRSPLSIEICRRKEYSALVMGQVEHLPLAEASVDLVVMADVLEHVQDDQQAIGECARVIRPGGILVLTVPAIPRLYGDHDQALGHFRRYSAGGLRHLLHSNGFKVVRITHFNGVFLPVITAVRLLRRILRDPTPRADPLVLPGILNGMAYVGLMMEKLVLALADIPLGISLLCIARNACAQGHAVGW